MNLDQSLPHTPQWDDALLAQYRVTWPNFSGSSNPRVRGLEKQRVDNYNTYAAALAERGKLVQRYRAARH